MTPLINTVVKHYSHIASVWDPAMTGWHAPQDFLGALAQADVYTVDEAEFDTTLSRQALPAHYSTGLNLLPTARAVWIEYKAYRSPIHPPEGRSAFFTRQLEGGDLRTMNVSWSDPQRMLLGVHMFDFPGDLVGKDVNIVGREFLLSNLLPPALEYKNTPGAANFFMELLAFVRLPSDELIVKSHDPLPATQRRFRAELGPGATLRPWKALRYAHGPRAQAAA